MTSPDDRNADSFDRLVLARRHRLRLPRVRRGRAVAGGVLALAVVAAAIVIAPTTGVRAESGQGTSSTWIDSDTISAESTFGAPTQASLSQALNYPRWGFSQGFQPIELPDSKLDPMLDGIVATGVKVIRMDLPWQQIQAGGQDAYDFTKVLHVYDAARAKGLTVLPVASGLPPWWTSTTSSPGYAYRFLQRAGQELIPRGITSIEIGNEINLTGMSPADYTQYMLIPGASGFRAAGTDLGKTVTIVSTGLAPAATGGGHYSQIDFLTGIYDAGGRGYFDAVGVHPYTWPADPAIATSWNWMQKTKDLYALMVSRGDAAKKVWGTEFGFPTNQGDRGIPESTQAAYIVNGVNVWRSFSWTGPLIFYSYQDLVGTDTDTEAHFGMIHTDGSKKPALDAMANAIAGR